MRHRGSLAPSTVVLVCALGVAASFATPVYVQPRQDAKVLYEKSEVMIPMRDGTRLFTIIYSPRDGSERHPILLTRTAYGIPPYGSDNYRSVIGPSAEFANAGYIVVYQDVRGKFKSEGEFIHHSPIIAGSNKPNESTDLGTFHRHVFAGVTAFCASGPAYWK